MKVMLWQERKAKGWTQEYVAGQVGISPEAVSMLETGLRKPSYEILVKLEDLFQLGHRELFSAATLANEPDGNPKEREESHVQ